MFRVRWKQSALNQLASLWIAADSHGRRAIVDSTLAIDRRLETNPHEQGESRPNGLRVLFEAPLGVTFRVKRTEPIVQVLKVWHFK